MMGFGVVAIPSALAWPVGMLLAALLGSFLNVCISRLPKGESIAFPPSHCPLCRTPIRPVDNIPLLSFALLAGRCRACRAPISWRYPLVEGLAVAVGALALWQWGLTWEGLRVFVFGLAMVVVAFTDLETRRIPDRVTLPGVVAALVFAPEGLSRGSAGALAGALVCGAVGWWRSGPVAATPVDPEDEVEPAERRRLDVYWAAAWGALLGRQLAVLDLRVLAAPSIPLIWRVLSQVDGPVAGCLVTGGVFFLVAWLSYVLLRKTGLGGGDIKLAGLIGATLGAGGGLVAAFLGIMGGGVVATALLVAGRRQFGQYLPFGPFLAAGGLAAGLWGSALLEWYLG